jgi:delta14-sterol reductase
MKPDLAGFFAPWLIYALISSLHLVLPARKVVGYARHETTGERLHYRLNGLPVALLVLAIWAAGVRGELLTADWLWTHRWASLVGAFSLGVLYTLFAVLRLPSTGRSILVDLFLGRAENPRYFAGRVDAKMLLYLVGAIMLELHLLSFGAHHVATFPEGPSRGVVVHIVLLSWFVFDYLTFERVHLWTYDLFAERVGFKLGWGCLVFYPYFYAVGVWSAAERHDLASTGRLSAAVLLFLFGWTLARGANLQKFTFKTEPNRVFLGLLEAKTLSDGEHTLLCGGFWGVSRHVNYLGEILMATGLALSLASPLAPDPNWWPWLYPAYYLALLIPRERDDDRRCAAKYGRLWQQYKAQVPYRIIPGLY